MADVKIAVVTFLCPEYQVTGNVDIVTTELGGRTPKAALFFCGSHAPANDATSTPQGSIGYGLTDGTNHRSMFALNAHGQTTQGLYAGQENTNCILGSAGGGQTPDIRASFVSWLENGVRVNFSRVNPLAPRRITAILFAGADLSAKVDSVNLGTVTTAIDVNTVGFLPSVVFGMGLGLSAFSTAYAFRPCIGFATNHGGTVKQRALHWSAREAAPPNNQLWHVVRNDVFNVRLNYNDGTVVYGTTIEAFDAQGFSVRSSGNASSSLLHYLALNTGGVPVDIVDFMTPTANGNLDVTSPWEPSFAMPVVSARQGFTTTGVASADSTGASIGAVSQEAQAALGIGIRNAITPSSTLTVHKAGSAVILPIDGTPQRAVAVASFLSTAMRLAFNPVDSSARQGFAVMLKRDDNLVPYTSGNRRSVRVT